VTLLEKIFNLNKSFLVAYVDNIVLYIFINFIIKIKREKDMTEKVDLHIYRVNHGSKRIKKIKLSTFIKNVNQQVFTKKFFTNRKDAETHIKKGQL